MQCHDDTSGLYLKFHYLDPELYSVTREWLVDERLHTLDEEEESRGIRVFQYPSSRDIARVGLCTIRIKRRGAEQTYCFPRMCILTPISFVTCTNDPF